MAEARKTPKRVLVVDDNVDAAELLAEALTLSGYDVFVAHDAPRALVIAQEHKPQVALLDIGLPVVDGYELAVKMREQWPEVRLVALTGYGQPSDRERSKTAGFDEHWVKPVSLQVVRETLERWLA
jgi:CheY-like chemotaxis protein